MTQDLHNALNKLRIDRKRKKPRRAGGLRLLLIVLLIGALAGGYLFYARAYAPVSVKVVRPEIEKPTSEGEEVLMATGYVIPRRKIEVSSKIIGRVKDMLVDRGQQVKRGDVLLQIDDEEYQAQVKLAEAQVAADEARLAELRAGSRPEEIQTARAAVASSEATLLNARQNFERLQSLRKQEVLSQQELDRGKAALDVAQAELKAARERSTLVEKGPRQEQIAAAAAQTLRSKANLDYARTQLDYTIIRAPVSGTILEKLAEKGELVTNVNFGGTRGAKSSVVSMADLNDLLVEIDVNEGDLPKVRLAQECRIKLDSVPDTVFKGRVDEIAPEADRQKATVQVKVAILDPRGLIRPEVNAQVSFLSDKTARAGESAAAGVRRPRIWVSQSALEKSPTDADGHIVYVVSQGKAVARAVKVGPEGPKGVEIVEGLDGTESIIAESLENVSDGKRVTVSQP